jgi:phosphoribosylamine--glycine ligase/phosphoribosylformylglycinamidine cyclo-ligase
MKRHGIPTAAYETFTSFETAAAYLDSTSHNVVIKADGLAAGKGVLIPSSREEATAGLRIVMLDKKFGTAGDAVVIEEFLEGQELSILAFCDGYTCLPMPASQDHKRVGDGDIGLNTGGMGTYSPSPLATRELEQRIVKEVLEPTMRGCRKDGA